jgi:hypothetical protein
MLAEAEVQGLVVEHLNSVGNFMNLQWDAQSMYHNMAWVIQAQLNYDKV